MEDMRRMPMLLLLVLINHNRFYPSRGIMVSSSSSRRIIQSCNSRLPFCSNRYHNSSNCVTSLWHSTPTPNTNNNSSSNNYHHSNCITTQQCREFLRQQHQCLIQQHQCLIQQRRTHSPQSLPLSDTNHLHNKSAHPTHNTTLLNLHLSSHKDVIKQRACSTVVLHQECELG